MAKGDLAALSVPSIGQPDRLANSVADVLRQQILSGQIPAGTRLLQIELAGRLGVSRTPLREAFRILEADGLVRISDGNKTVEVAHLDVQDLHDNYVIRQVIDGLAARLAAMRTVDDELMNEMRAGVEVMDRLSTGKLDTEAYQEAHTRWHLNLLKLSGNGQLEEFGRLVRVASHYLVLRQLSEEELEAFSTTLETLPRAGNADHRRILDAIIKGKAEVAEQIAIKHMGRACKFTQDVLTRRATRNRRR